MKLSPSNHNNETMIASTRQCPTFPHSLLSSSLPSHRGAIHHHPANMCRHYPRTVANDNSNSSRGSSLLSASIPLPKSHIHRTPSELQLADDILRAEYEDVRMCVRLVSGMQTQCRASGYVHPRTMQSVQDILKTKRANTNQLEEEQYHHHQPVVVLPLHEHSEEEDDEEEDEEEENWGLAYEEDDADDSAVGTPTPCHPPSMMLSEPCFLIKKSPSDDSALSTTAAAAAATSSISMDDSTTPEDDECVFSLEL